MPKEKDDINFNWLSMMQHYGAPSRMLDFSFSPYVALFFAISGIDTEAVVFCVKYSELQEIDNKFYPDIDDIKTNVMKQNTDINRAILIPYEPQFTNNRIMAQQGAFLIPNTINYSHDDILNKYDNDNFVYKIIIHEEIAYQLIEKLAQMNISSINIYPGLEGFCKSFENIGIIPINRLRPINTELNA